MPTSEVFNMDCMEGMKQYHDKYFELAIVDPPYGIDVNKMTLGSGKYKSNKKWDSNTPTQEYFDVLFTKSKNQIIWGANYMIDKIKKPSMGWIYWDKENGNSDFSDGELAYTSFNRALRSIKRHISKDKSQRFHPTQKPIYLYKWILTNYAKPGDKILDTHLGSGSSRIAAYDMGFDFVGYELDKEYFDASCKRFDEYKQQLKLF